MELNSLPTFYTLVMRALAKYPARIAFRQGDAQLSYRQVSALIAGEQAVFRAHGFGRGAKIAFLSENRPEPWCANVAAQGLGIATTWLHPLSALDLHVDQLAELGAVALVIDTDAFATRARELADRVPGLMIFSVGAATVGHDLMHLADESADVPAQDIASSGDIVNLSLTGGTTGRSKIVMKSGASVAMQSITLNGELGMPDCPRYLALAPISHVSGQLILPTLMRGGTIHLARKFDVDEFVRIVERERINATLMVPTMVYRLLDAAPDRAALQSLELIAYAGSVISPDRLGQAMDLVGPVFAQIYAQAECTPIAILSKEHHDRGDPASLQACGTPVSTVQLAIASDAGEYESDPGKVGEICVRGPAVTAGYLDNPDETGVALADGWLHTGDIGFIDEFGRLSIVDRKKDMIVTGGTNVYPREVEDLLNSHPDVSSCAVIGVPHESWGEAVHAFIILRPGHKLPAEALQRHVRDRKGPLYAPKTIDIVGSLPLTAVGKVDKQALRAPFWKGRARNVA